MRNSTQRVSTLRRVLFMAALASLVGCANTSVLKVDKQLAKDKPMLLVPTGNQTVGMMSNSTGGAFGLLGMAIEAAVTSERRGAVGQLSTEALSTSTVQNMVMTEVQASLRKNGWSNQLTAHAGTLPAVEFKDWFNPDQRLDVSQLSNPKQALVMDYGFQELIIIERWGKAYANSMLGVRVIDPQSGKVLGRARVYSNGDRGELIEGSYSKEAPMEYRKAVVTAYEKLIRRQIDEAMNTVMGFGPVTQ